MYTSSLLAAAGLASVASAAHFEKRQDASAISASIASLVAELAPPTDLAPSLSTLLSTAIPASVHAAATDPASLAAVQSEFASGIPPWFASLPTEAQSYYLGQVTRVASIQPQLESLSSQAAALGAISSSVVVSNLTAMTTAEVVPSLATSSGVPGNASSSSSSNRSSSSSGGSTSTTRTRTGGDVEETGTSSAGAAQATAAVAMGMAGAVGFVGMMLAL